MHGRGRHSDRLREPVALSSVFAFGFVFALSLTFVCFRLLLYGRYYFICWLFLCSDERAFEPQLGLSSSELVKHNQCFCRSSMVTARTSGFENPTVQLETLTVYTM
eukprot:10545503-Heterocapsa_arctica.AAC.1